MTPYDFSPRKVLLLGLEEAPQRQIQDILSRQRHDIRSQPFPPVSQSLALVDEWDADVICCAAKQEHYESLVEALRNRGVPVVVVSSDPTVSEWLDAIEAGASDYLGAPFESKHIQHVLENVVRCSAAAN